MIRHDHVTPFDRELDEPRDADLTEEFWGSESRWRSSGRTNRLDDTTGSIRAIRDGVAAFRPQRVELRDPTGQVQRTRTHGVTRPTQPTRVPASELSIGDLAAGRLNHDGDDVGDDPFDHEIPLEPNRRSVVGLDAIDPLLVRLGIILLVGTLLVPLALALRPGDADSTSVTVDDPVGDVDADTGVTGATAPTGAPAAGDSADAATATGDEPTSSPATGDRTDDTATGGSAAVAAAGDDTTSVAAVAAAPDEPAATDDEPVGDVAQSVDSGLTDAATVDATAERVVPSCPQTYTAGAGDSWYRIADAAGVAPSAVFDVNNATADTLILPGDEICLPAGAAMPTPPTTAAPETTAAPTTTDAPNTNAPSTTASTTTTEPAPTTVSGSPGRDATVDEVKALIRSIFPESEWETAYVIADRESRFRPTAYNGWCCYGVFQIYYSVHRSWLPEVGVNSSSDLYDPLLNVRAAHVLWERAGNSWSPWSTYDG